MGIWATNLLHRFSDAMQLCCALEVGTFFMKILLRIAIMAIFSRPSHPYQIAKLRIGNGIYIPHFLCYIYSNAVYIIQPTQPMESRNSTKTRPAHRELHALLFPISVWVLNTSHKVMNIEVL